MRLTINGETVSYTLEQEKTLGQVVAGIRAWLAAEGFVMTRVAAEGHDLIDEAAVSWGGRDVVSVKELTVEADRTADMKLAHWQNVDTWLGLLAHELVSQSAVLPDLLADLSQTIAGFKVNPFLPSGSDALRRFEALFAASGDGGVASWPPDRRAAAGAVVHEMLAAVRQRLSDAAHPGEALARCAAQLQGTATTLPEVSVLLQTNRDKEAMGLVIGFADAVQWLMDLLPFLPPDAARARALTDLTPVLRELVAAFDTRDSVLIGDILEYEIAPRMNRIAPLLERKS